MEQTKLFPNFGDKTLVQA